MPDKNSCSMAPSSGCTSTSHLSVRLSFFDLGYLLSNILVSSLEPKYIKYIPRFLIRRILCLLVYCTARQRVCTLCTRSQWWHWSADSDSDQDSDYCYCPLFVRYHVIMC